MADEADTSTPSDMAFFSPFCSDNFVFLVGKEKQRFNVNVDILGRISLPLKTLMTNGAMKESIQGFAELPDMEPRTFDLILQFAYNGLRGACALPTESQYWIPETLECIVCDAPFSLRNLSCSKARIFPCCDHSCWDDWTGDADPEDNARGRCLVPDCTSDVIYDHYSLNRPSMEILCISHKHLSTAKSMPSTKGELVQAHRRHKRLAVSLHFWLGRRDRYHAEDPIRRHLSTLDAGEVSTVVDVDPLDYVKLYAAADQYIIPTLKSVASHLLYMELSFFEVTASSVPQILELLDCVWELPVEKELRFANLSTSMRAVMFDYIRSQKAQLMQCDSFMDFLADGHNAALSRVMIQSLATELYYVFIALRNGMEGSV